MFLLVFNKLNTGEGITYNSHYLHSGLIAKNCYVKDY